MNLEKGWRNESQILCVCVSKCCIFVFMYLVRGLDALVCKSFGTNQIFKKQSMPGLSWESDAAFNLSALEGKRRLSVIASKAPPKKRNSCWISNCPEFASDKRSSDSVPDYFYYLFWLRNGARFQNNNNIFFKSKRNYPACFLDKNSTNCPVLAAQK